MNKCIAIKLFPGITEYNTFRAESSANEFRKKLIFQI